MYDDWHDKDERIWEEFRLKKASAIMSLIDLLQALRVINSDHRGKVTVQLYEYIDRHWSD